MKKKIRLSILLTAIGILSGFSPIYFSGISFSGDDFGESGFHHWQKCIVEAKDSKNLVLLEMLGEAAEESDGLTFRILQIHGPHLFYGDNPNNKRDFQQLLLNIFKTHDLQKLKSFYGIKDGESDLHIARVFQIVFYLYAVETGFSYRLRENLKETLDWQWSDLKSPELLSQIVRSMDEFLGPKVSYHIRARVKNIQNVGGTEKAVVVTEWELVEVEGTYNPQRDEMEQKESVIEKQGPQAELLDKGEAEKIEGDYGTKSALPLDREAAITLFQSLLKASRIFENPSPRELGSSNWERLISLLPEGMNFQPIPAGTFEMGSPNGEGGRDNDEALHRVS
ncbi:MAG: hypothetical protein AAB309_06060, partial [Deltaproteobacteria bacterium]